METIKWGILATGGIAQSLARALTDQPDAELVAVGSRSQESADRFGDQWDIPRRHATYEGLANDPQVDVIYIATPHNLHYDNMKLCLNAGKHVLCEKPLTINSAQAEECIALAKEKNLFLMEAVWTRFIPAIQQAQAWINEGRIGDVRLVQADFTYRVPFDLKGRLFNPELAGGALLDMGIYPVTLAHLVLGVPQKVISYAHLAVTGVDDLNSMIFVYDNGATATLNSSHVLNKPMEAYITGTKGYIKVHDQFFHPQALTIQTDDDPEPITVEIPYDSNGYIHEVREVHACLRAGKIESEIMPWSNTLEIMKLMDDMRAQWGIIYPQEM